MTTVLAEKRQNKCTSTHLHYGRSSRRILFTSSLIEPERLCCNAVNKYERNIKDARSPHISRNTCVDDDDDDDEDDDDDYDDDDDDAEHGGGGGGGDVDGDYDHIR